MLGDDSNARQHIFDAVVEFCNQQILTLLRLLPPGDIAGQALEPFNAAVRVEFRLRSFLKPHFPPIRANETKTDRIGGVVEADAINERLETRVVVFMNPREELGGGEGPLWIKAQGLRRVLAAL